MAYCGHKKEDIEDTSMERHWKSARPAKAWNPFGQLPAPQRGGGGEEESCASNNAFSVFVAVPPSSLPKKTESRSVCICA